MAGFFSRLKEGLTKTRDNIVNGIDSVFSGFSSIDDEFYEELEEIRKKLQSGAIKPMESLNIRVKKMKQDLTALKAEQVENRKECKDIEELMARRQNAEIAVSGNIYRGTVVCFAQMQIPIEHNTCFMKYYQQRGMIESSVIAYS